jgi:hypothetical protein
VHVVPDKHESVTYKQGAPIVISECDTSVVMLMPAQSSFQRGDRLKFYINIQNIAQGPFEVDISDVKVTTDNDQEIAVFTYETIEKEIKNAEMWKAIAAGIQAAGEGLEANRAGYSSTNSSGVVSVYDSQGSTYGRFSGSNTTYDASKRSAAQKQANLNSQHRMAEIAKSSRGAMAEAELLLRRTTIGPGEGFDAAILIDAPEELPSNLQLSINMNGEVHVIDYAYEALDSKQVASSGEGDEK